MKIAYNIFHILDESSSSLRRNLYKSATEFLDKCLPKLDTPTINLTNVNSAEQFIINHDDFNPVDEFKPGEIGIWASNFLSWKNLIDSEFDALLNFEDDVFLMCDFYDKLKLLVEELPSDWDFFSLYVPPNQQYLYNESLDISQNVCKVFQGWSLLACMVSRSGAKKALDLTNCGFHEPLDFFILKNPNRFNVYTVTPRFENIISLISVPSSIQSDSSKVKIKPNFFSSLSFKEQLSEDVKNNYLYINFYIDQLKERQSELDFCLLENISNKLFNKIVIICDDNAVDYLKSIVPDRLKHKLEIRLQSNRPTYNDFFSLMSEVSNKGNNLNFLSNLDIIIPEKTIVDSKSYFNLDRNCICLTRYDVLSNNDDYVNNSEFFGKSYSQDVWIFRGSPSVVDGADIPLGKPGCDNTIAKLLSYEGFILKNPSLNLKVYHLHLVGIRRGSMQTLFCEGYFSDENLRLPYKFIPITY